MSKDGKDRRINLAEIHFDVWPYGTSLWVERRAVGYPDVDPTDLERLNLYIGGAQTFESVPTAVLRTASQLRGLAYLCSAKAIVNEHAEERRAPKLGGLEETCGCVSAEGVYLEFGGACPVQGFGMIHGHPAYYRARGRSWSIEIYPVGTKPEEDHVHALWYVHEHPYAFPDGGWLHRDESIDNITRAAAAFAARL